MLISRPDEVSFSWSLRKTPSNNFNYYDTVDSSNNYETQLNDKKPNLSNSKNNKKKKKNIILQNEDDEFNYFYSSIMIEIKFEFMDYINNCGFPFMENSYDIIFSKKYNFYDFVKYNSFQYNIISNTIQTKNKKIMNLLNNKDKLDKSDMDKINFINSIENIDDLENLDDIDYFDEIENNDYNDNLE
jgi:hypothetical protein